jgi:predicted  nucleic acid-binding Zn-ribbon protein
LEEDQDAEVTKEDLRDKIAQLNNAIDEISNQLSETDGAVQTASRS